MCAGSYHLHSPDNAGSPFQTLLQHAGDPRLQRGDWMKWETQLRWTADSPPLGLCSCPSLAPYTEAPSPRATLYHRN